MIPPWGAVVHNAAVAVAVDVTVAAVTDVVTVGVVDVVGLYTLGIKQTKMPNRRVLLPCWHYSLCRVLGDRMVKRKSKSESRICTKYPITDDGYDLKLLAACRTPTERGMISLLTITGMHVSTLEKLSAADLRTSGDRVFVEYRRMKNAKPMRFEIPPDRLEDVRVFLNGKKRSRQHYHAVVKQVGELAGYPGISPMTLRHSACISFIKKAGAASIFVVPHQMGCSLNIVVRNYAALSPEQLSDLNKKVT